MYNKNLQVKTANKTSPYLREGFRMGLNKPIPYQSKANR